MSGDVQPRDRSPLLAALLLALVAGLFLTGLLTPRAPRELTCGPDWYNARLTHFDAYPSPDSEECIAYNGCQWSGMFYGVQGRKSPDWVQETNIVAVHQKDWDWLGKKILRLRQNGQTIDARALDICSDADCEGCCTANLGDTNHLIDVEINTLMRMGGWDGPVEFQICG